MSNEKVKLETRWVITLNSGDIMSVCADEMGIDGDDRIFTVSIGESRKEVVVARVPTSLIRDVIDEYPDDDPEAAQP